MNTHQFFSMKKKENYQIFFSSPPPPQTNTNRSEMVKFSVHDVTPKNVEISTTGFGGLKNAWMTHGRVEACGVIDSSGVDYRLIKTFADGNVFASMVYKSFYEHLPMIIDPDVVWITIVQSFAKYVGMHSEELRDKFVTHQDKLTLVVARPEFIKGSKTNDWPGAIAEFRDQIKANTIAVQGIDPVGLLECNFTTTSFNDKIVSHVAIMDTFQHYFKYEMLCGCGIPSIELTGTAGDWQTILTKVKSLLIFKVEPQQHINLDEWVDDLVFVLEHFVAAVEGNVDITFWGSVCNMSGLSGKKGAPMTGWINAFFMFDKDGHVVKCNIKEAVERAKTDGVANSLYNSQQDCGKFDGNYVHGGMKLDHFPSGVSSAPVQITWNNSLKSENYKFCGGLAVIEQRSSDGALRVKSGWAIVEEQEN